MQTRLTVDVEKELIDSAKHYAETHGTTIPRLIAEFFQKLGSAQEAVEETPILRRLTGILPATVSAEEHRRNLVEKYDL